jgi:hypothetical protein
MSPFLRHLKFCENIETNQLRIKERDDGGEGGYLEISIDFVALKPFAESV